MFGRRSLHRPARTACALPPAELARWAEGLYGSSVLSPPSHGAIFTMDQLEVHARSLAAAHHLGQRRGSDWLLRRLGSSERIIARCHAMVSEAHAAGRRLTPAAEWLLDNHYLVEEQIRLTQRHFPRGYCRRLPRLASNGSAGMPRIYDLVQQYISHVDGRVDDEALARTVAAYQSVTHLTLGELWSVAIMLRLSLVENLRHVAENLSWQRVHRDCALAWASRIDAPGDKHETAVLVLADLVRENPPLSTAFVAQFTQALQGRGATTTFVQSWLEQRLAERGQTIEEVVRAESQAQAADQASMANSIASLRLVNAFEWHAFVEEASASEAILRSEPAGVYARMDFATRDEYRHQIEGLATRYDLDEEAVARAAVALAAARHAEDADDVAGHVGYVLVDDGRQHLERELRGKRAVGLFPRRLRRLLELVAYLGPVALLSATGVLVLALLAHGAPGGAELVLALGALLAASQSALAVVNWVASYVRSPRALPRLDFEHGIPDAYRTMVVVPTLLTGPGRVAAIVEGLELRYLANRDPNLGFALLTDFCDAPEEHLEGDDALLDVAAKGIEELNAKYGDGPNGRFFLFHRPRLHNPQEGCWMGRERKRGKIEDFNSLIGGVDTSAFSRVVGDTSELTSIRYVITLDTDTGLPWGAGWRLVGAAAHPLNRPVTDPDRRRLLRGYAILQPRVSISLGSADQSLYSRLLAGDVGLDPYTRVVSDVYQDLFAETSFIGKGIYDVGAFRELLDGRFPDNAVLSHDLLESCYARSAQCSDVELLEDSPSSYLADASRRHRWMRGDWQIAPWLGPRVSDSDGVRAYPSIAALGWWKIFDNLRRAFVAPAYTLLLALGWFALPEPLPWTLGVLGLLILPEVLPSLADLWQRAPRLPLRTHLATVGLGTARRLSRVGLWLAFLPFEATIALDAAGRSLWRMAFSRRHLLEWQTAAAVERVASPGLAGVLRRMVVGPALALGLAAALGVLASPSSLAAAGPLLLAWLLSPLIAWAVSRPLRSHSTPLAEDDALFLRRVARLTWRYFEVFVGPQENWLVPDNFQEVPAHRVAHRTSPTDLGLALVSSLAAHDLGYLSGGQLLDRTTRTLDSMSLLERHRGHFFNWYDTQTRRALAPLYVSTVDSGNLVGHARVLQSGLLELPSAPLLPPGARDGLDDTARELAGLLGPNAFLEAVGALLRQPFEGLEATAIRLAEVAAACSRLTRSIDRQRQPEAAWWANALERQAHAFLADLSELAPWLAIRRDPTPGEETPSFATDLDRATTLEALGSCARRAATIVAATPGAGGGTPGAELYWLGAERIRARIEQVQALAARCDDLAAADFSFLYDRRRKLMALGYWAAERRAETSFYDLLASEARLASYLAIATGQVPFEHWFALGRRLTLAGGRQALLSWSGSMFEYLMPMLVMPAFPGTLLHQTCRAAVTRQIEYGKQRGVPWGISESCYAVTDGEGTYQYRAFGVPGLGLQRGLGDDVVIAPYASTLALLVEPRRAAANLRGMAADGVLGGYGFYEAVDYTPARVPEGERAAVVRSFMAHHHGMSLLALEHAVLGPRMRERFLRSPDLQAAALLLQERIPKATTPTPRGPREPRLSGRVAGPSAEAVMRAFTNPNTPIPEVHLLSNGRYHVMVSAAGAGYSRWNDLDVTRWREDPTSEALGVFCYVGDPATRHVWSGAFQPTLRAGRQYEAVFTPGRAEFRRQDDHIETHTEIAVSSEDDLEIRRVKLTNRSDEDRTLVVTGFAEVVLAPGVSDALHRVFSSLFVHTELLPEASAILLTRRPRSAGEQPPWMFCLMPAAGATTDACSYETDRARFLGRGRGAGEPAALDDWGPLSGTAGSVLDPCVALRRSVDVPGDGSAQLDLVLGVAPTREAALALIAKYQDHRMADRVFETAAAYSRASLGHLGASEQDAQRYGRLASAVIFPVRACRAAGSVLRRNRKGPSGLWAYGISGDLPIVLLRVSDVANLGLASDLLRAHAYWRTRGLATDLVIWNEDASGYRRLLNDDLLALIAAGTESQLVDKSGGVFVRHVGGFPEEDRVLLQSVARLVVLDGDGPLDRQMDRWRRRATLPRASMLALSRRAPSSGGPVAPTTPRDDLIFANGTGGFTRDGREYIIDLPPHHHTPAPWVNVIANPRLGTVVSESGSAYTWYGNAQLGRLTPWSNDPVGDPSGEVLYVRDEASGRFFSPMPWPRTSDAAYACRHGFGYSIFEHAEEGLQSTLTTYVAVDAPVKFLSLKLKNPGSRARTVSVFACVDLVLGDLRPRQAMHVTTEREPLTGAIVAKNYYNQDFAGAVAFFDCSEPARSVSGDRAEFQGRNGHASSPAALRLRALSGRLGPGLDPCAAIQARLELAAGAEREVVFVLGAGSDTAEAVTLIQRHKGVAAARVALKEVWKFWSDTLGVLYAETPDAALNVMVNGWLPYQVLSCRLWARSGFYQSGGAFGFRDQLQDALALLHEVPDLVRQHLLRSAERQFVEGDVQHWWHPPAGRGVRTRCSDDYLWLPYAVARYVAFTGDTGVLDERLAYLTGRPLNDDEESYYDLPGRSGQSGTLYEHCTKALRHASARGEHGLPLMGSGDWNDGMNRVGLHGRGESVWLAFFLHEVLSGFAVVAAGRGDDAFATTCREDAAELAAQVELHGWDGHWYRRATFDSGEPLGTAAAAECRIDSLPQSWATIAGVGSRERREAALDAMWEHLVHPELQLIQLLDPPFDHATEDPGYIRAYPPGVRENGGQYTHAAVWAALALALAGRGEQAAQLVTMLNPIHHALDPAAVERYRLEPYVLTADVYSREPHAGRGGWSWYTGSAAWLYRLVHEVLFGLVRRADTLRFSPQAPPSWTRFTLHYRYHQTFYHLVYAQSPTHAGPLRVTLDGRPVPDGVLTLVNDRREHAVEVTFHPRAAEAPTVGAP